MPIEDNDLQEEIEAQEVEPEPADGQNANTFYDFYNDIPYHVTWDRTMRQQYNVPTIGTIPVYYNDPRVEILEQEDRALFDYLEQNAPIVTGINTATGAVDNLQIAVTNQEKIIVEGTMTYEQLKNRYPDFTDRYIPDLSKKDNAYSALQWINNDPKITPAELEALRAYLLEFNPTQPTITYNWCDVCDSMVGIAHHVHCPRCAYPCVTDNGNELIVGAIPVIAICLNCKDCCKDIGCRTCNGCNGHCTQICKHCKKCNKTNNGKQQCCVCRLCPRCGEIGDCDDCTYCFECCQCPAPRVGSKIWHATKLTERKKFNSKRLSGIEWEFNEVKMRKHLKKWGKKWVGNTVRDGSCGEEAVSPPVAGDHMIDCIESLGDAFKQSGAKADGKCGIHVHIDAKDILWSDMFRLIRVYEKIEPIMYILAGQDRINIMPGQRKHYCAPCGQEYLEALQRTDRKDALIAIALGHGPGATTFAGRRAQRQQPGKRAEGRYRGLNICPWLAGRIRKGLNGKRAIAPDTTVEFRMHKNTLDPQRIIGWTKLCTRLVDWVANSSDTDCENLPKSPLRALCQIIAPDCAPWILSRIKEWRKETPKSKGDIRKVRLINGKYKY